VIALPAPSSEALARFRRTNVRPQRQEGYLAVTVSLPQGDVTAAQLEALADLALAYGDGAVRLASEGRLALRWIRAGDLPSLHARLSGAGLARDGAGSAGDVVSCPGAELCRLAVTRNRGVARLVDERVRAHLPAGLDAPLPVHASGCPNGCSRHHVAAIGLQGSARKVGDRTIPQYFVLLGGKGGGETRFGTLAAKIPARRVPEAVERLTGLYLSGRGAGEEAADFFARRLDAARALLAPLEELRPEDVRPEDLVEPGADGPFAPDVQAGECAA
jgi:sulfite reductase (NADPH) hemoprotein beta-component